MQIEEHLVRIGIGQPFGCDNAHRNTSHLVFNQLIGTEASPFETRTCGAGVHQLADSGHRRWWALVRLGAAESVLRFGADGLWNGYTRVTCAVPCGSM